MELKELLPRAHVLVPLEATTLRQALTLLVDKLSGRRSGLRPREASHGSAIAGRGRRRRASRPPALPYRRGERLVVVFRRLARPLDAYDAGLNIHPRIVVDPRARGGDAVSPDLRSPSLHAGARSASGSTPDDVQPSRSCEDSRPAAAHVRDIMSHRVDSVTPETSVHAVDLMVRHGCALGRRREARSSRDRLRMGHHAGAAAPDPQGRRRTVASDEALRQLKIRDIMSRSVLHLRGHGRRRSRHHDQ